MKNIFKLTLLASMALVIIVSCTKDEHKDYFMGGTAPVLTSSSTAPALNFPDSSKTALTLSWTNPDYQFTTGLSSQDVSYIVEIDTTGANFTGPYKQSIAVSKDMSVTFTVAQLNNYLLNMLLDTAVSHSLDVRVTATLVNNSVPLKSNTIKITAKPYPIPPKVTPPASNVLYITGNAVASDWTNTPPETQKFTRKSATLYEIVIPLIGGNSYTFLPTLGSWNDKYSIATKNDPAEVNGGDFQWQGNDILAPAASGVYKITVNFQTGKFTVTAQ